jgi:hypothetical protein
MTISDRTRKLLWGRAGNRCAICRQELVISDTEGERDSIVGEECHIVARETDGPRGASDLTDQQRDDYENLILLCNVHHKQIDDQVARFPVERLKSIKVHHERWVRTSLNALNGTALSSDSQPRDDGPLIVSSLDHLAAQDLFRVRRESDGSIIEISAAPSGHVGKTGKFLGDGWGFSLTNNTRLSARINRILVDVLSTERLSDIELVMPTGMGGGAERHIYWCELFPDTGVFECRYVSDVYDYVKILGGDLEYFEVYFVDRSFENRLYSIQMRIDFTLGANEHSITLEPISLAFIEDWWTEYIPRESNSDTAPRAD